MTPFFDTRDAERIKLALTVLKYPDRYCLNDENLQRLERLLPSADGVRKMVQLLIAAQTKLAPHLPMPFNEAWRLRETLAESVMPTTVYTGSALPADSTEVLSRPLDRALLEDALETMAKGIGGPAQLEGIRLAVACSWLSQHLALVAIGLATAELTNSGEISIEPASSNAVKHLRRLWFAAAFEDMSVEKAQASLEIYALLANGSKALNGDVEYAFNDAVSLIPQHWRLPAHDGPVAQLLKNQLIPLIWLAGAVFHASQFRSSRQIVQRDLPSPKAYRKVFADVIEHQLKLHPLDRVFEVRKGGLVAGPRKLAPGLMLIAEQLAANRLGPEWHDRTLSEVQKAYLIERLEGLSHVQVVDVQVTIDDTTNKVHVDVDLFIRDLHNKILFAVQLKHFKYSAKGGLCYWLNRFQPGKGLAYAIAQLQSFYALANNDSKVRTKLIASGITTEELYRVVPVVLHNIGLMDCLAFQAGILIYDQHTFVNVLDGRSAVGVGVVDGQAVNTRIAGSSMSCRLDDPDEVILAYVVDPQFAALKHFDAVAEITRRLNVIGSAVTARGLGI